jgi:hydroxymethylglutaryl-CoA reductase
MSLFNKEYKLKMQKDTLERYNKQQRRVRNLNFLLKIQEIRKELESVTDDIVEVKIGTVELPVGVWDVYMVANSTRQFFIQKERLRSNNMTSLDDLVFHPQYKFTPNME